MITQHLIQKLSTYFAAQPVDAVYLFGSQATGKANNLSDIDLAILFAAEADEKTRFAIRLAALGMTSGGKLPDTSDVIDLDAAPLALAYQAIAPRNLLYEKNRDHVIEKEIYVIKQYLDFRTSLFAIARRHLELLAEKGFPV